MSDRKKTKRDPGKRGNKALFVLVGLLWAVLALPIEGSALTSTRAYLDRTADAQEVRENIILAAKGRFSWRESDCRRPFMPKGFPQWGMTEAEAIDSIGENGEDLAKENIGGVTFCLSDRFALGFLDGKFVAVAFGKINTKDIWFTKVLGWEMAQRESPEASSALLRHHFATYSDCQGELTEVYLWVRPESIFSTTPCYSIVATKAAAQAMGVIN